ncbi:MAG: hypothetical protein ACLTYW_02445 [Collinsella sp.]
MSEVIASEIGNEARGGPLAPTMPRRFAAADFLPPSSPAKIRR